MGCRRPYALCPDCCYMGRLLIVRYSPPTPSPAPQTTRGPLQRDLPNRDYTLRFLYQRYTSCEDYQPTSPSTSYRRTKHLDSETSLQIQRNTDSSPPNVRPNGYYAYNNSPDLARQI